jgi:hypothetical protein
MEMWDGFWIIIALVAAADRLSRIPVAAIDATGAAAPARRWRFGLRGAPVRNAADAAPARSNSQ